MLKKIIVWILLIVASALAVIVLYIYHIRELRPVGAAPSSSRVINSAFQAEAIAAANWMESVYAQQNFPSLSVAVGVDGQLVWHGVIGYADLGEKSAANIDTRYRIGSISKSFTAVTAMRLHEQGKLNIDEQFGHYVQDYPAQFAGISLRQLLSHQAGVRHYLNEIAENFSSTEYESTRAAAQIVAQEPLLFKPGYGFNYSTYGYTLLALAMEQAVQMPFPGIMQAELLEPFGLHATQLNRAKQAVNNLSIPYLEVGGNFYKSPEPNVSNKYAGGGFVSTPSDVVTFANELMANRLVSDIAREALWLPQTMADGRMNPENYALGFRVGVDDLGRYVHHGGMSVGGYSMLLIYPEQKLVVALASNVTPEAKSFDRLSAAQQLAQIFVRD